MVSCLMGDSTALASAIVRCCLRNIFFSNAIDELLIQYISQRFVTQIEKLMFIYMELLFEIAETFDYLNNENKIQEIELTD